MPSGIKLIHFIRHVLSRYHYKEEVSLGEKLALFEAVLRLETKSTDPGFQKEYGATLEVISTELVKTSQCNTIRALNTRLRKLSQLQFPKKDFLLPRGNLEAHRALYGKIQLIPQQSPGTPVSLLPPKKVIGKGYTDKGAMKDSALHGEQHWTELSSDFLLQIEETENELQREKHGTRNSKKIGELREKLYTYYGRIFDSDREGIYETCSRKGTTHSTTKVAKESIYQQTIFGMIDLKTNLSWPKF